MNNLMLLSESILTRYQKSTHKLKVCVVGNSGIENSDQEMIDKSDVVIRHNNYGSRAGIIHTRDKLKCDILFSTFDLHTYGAQPKDVVIGIPFPFKAKEIEPKPDRWYPDARHWMVNPFINMKMCEELKIDSLGASHPLPSIGFTSLYHMHNYDAQFYVCGYSWYYDDNTGLFQNWDLKNKNYPKTWNHCYPKEIEWIIKNLMTKDNITFSHSCNRILDIAIRQLK